MNLQEFKERINLAETCLKEANSHGEYYGVCVALDIAFYPMVGEDFNKLFEHEGDGEAYWLGPRTKENIPKRIKYLRRFEKIAIEKKLYESYCKAYE